MAVASQVKLYVVNAVVFMAARFGIAQATIEGESGSVIISLKMRKSAGHLIFMRMI